MATITDAILPQTVADASLTAFLISLGVVLFIAGCILLLRAVSFNFGNGEINEYTRLLDGTSGRDHVPQEFLNDEEAMNHLAEEYDLSGVSPEELSAYKLGEQFTQMHPRKLLQTKGGTFTPEDLSLIKERGIEAFEFEQEFNDNILDAKYLVVEKTDLLFQNNSQPYSTATAVMNFPLPVKNRTHADTIYFETKIFEFDNTVPNAHFSIGLVTKPYPSKFRLPGYNNFSIGYESTGNLKINKPLPTPLQQHMGDYSQYNAQVLPALQQSDVVGFGYVIPSGTIFITRNGKKVLDVMSGLFLDLHPAVGCFLTNARFQVNIGQLGFVWVEANVKKYAFVSTSDYRKIRGEQGMAALPNYSTLLVEDTVLAKGEELPPDYPEDELDFFGRSIQATTSSAAAAANASAESGDGANGNSQAKLNEKVEVKESFSQITNEPEEIMDLRERIYEQTITNDESSSVLVPANDKPLGESTEDLLIVDEAPKATSAPQHVDQTVEVPLEPAPHESGEVTSPDAQPTESEPVSSPSVNDDASNGGDTHHTEDITSSENTPEPGTNSATKSKTTTSASKKKKKKGKSSKKKGKKK